MRCSVAVAMTALYAEDARQRLRTIMVKRRLI